MKKIKITENQFKRIINNYSLINEDSDENCIKQLTDDDGIKYKVINTATEIDKCKTKPNISCVLESLKNLGLDITNNDIVFNGHSSGWGCYILLKSKIKVSNDSKFFMTIWEDGDVTYTHTLNKSLDLTINKIKYTTNKLVYEGNFKCDSDNKDILIKNLFFSGIIDSKTKNKIKYNNFKFNIDGKIIDTEIDIVDTNVSFSDQMLDNFK